MAVVAAMALASNGCGNGVEIAPGSSGSGGSTSTVAATSGSSSSGTATGAGGTAPACPPADGVMLAMDQIDIGESQDPEHDWRALGFDLDGLVTHPNSYSTVCTAPGASPAVVNFDGPSGQDNSFGKYLVPQLAFYPPMTTAFNDGLTKGEHTMMLDFVGLTPAPDHAVQLTRMYRGAPLGSIPAFDGSDCWPVNRDWLNNPADIDSSTTTFEKSSIVANQWVSGDPRPMKVTVPFMQGGTLTLRIHNARMALDLATDHRSGAKGMLGGILDPNELLVDLQTALGTTKDACSLQGSFKDSVNNALDIMMDGTQDPKKDCTGISIGLGFTMKEVRRGVVAPTVPPDPLCP